MSTAYATPLTLAPGTHRLVTTNTVYVFTLYADGSGIAESENRETGIAGIPFRFVGLEFQLSEQGLTAVFNAHCALDRDPHDYAADGNYRSLFTSPVKFIKDITL